MTDGVSFIYMLLIFLLNINRTYHNTTLHVSNVKYNLINTFVNNCVGIFSNKIIGVQGFFKNFTIYLTLKKFNFCLKCDDLIISRIYANTRSNIYVSSKLEDTEVNYTNL